MGVAQQRILAERKNWRKDKPFGFFARPEVQEDGSDNIFRWKCQIPGKEKTDWEGGYFPLTIEFSEDYPSKPPKCKFPPKFYHPNIYPSGTVCLSILNEDEGWRPSITVKQIVTGIQELLNDPNPHSPAQSEAFIDFTQKKTDYKRKVLAQTKRHPMPV